MVAPDVVSVIVTICAPVYVPGAGENFGFAAVTPATSKTVPYCPALFVPPLRVVPYRLPAESNMSFATGPCPSERGAAKPYNSFSVQPPGPGDISYTPPSPAKPPPLAVP